MRKVRFILLLLNAQTKCICQAFNNLCDGRKKAYGQLLQLGFDVNAFTPASYQGRRLHPPLKEITS